MPVISDLPGLDFTTLTAPGFYIISGSVGVEGVSLTYTLDGVEYTVLSGADGNYFLEVPLDWSGSVTPAKEGYSFSPDHKDYIAISADLSGEDYSASVYDGFVAAPAQMRKTTVAR